MKEWQIIQDEMIGDHRIVLKYREFGKGRGKIRKWVIERDGVKAGYAVNAQDAAENFARVSDGYVLNTTTGSYEPAWSVEGHS